MKRKIRLILIAVVAFALGMAAVPESADAAAKPKIIGPPQAKAIVLKEAGLNAGMICKYSIKYDKKDMTYEIHFYKKKGCVRYAYDITRVGGVITERDVSYRYRKCSTRSRIGVTAARNKVISVTKVKPAIVRAAKCVYRYKNGEGSYQITFRLGNRIYEYELVAHNGKVKEIEYKYIGKRPKL